MPSKKKSKPSFNVPEELQAAPQAGWVYRSDNPASFREEEAPASQNPADAGLAAIQESNQGAEPVPPAIVAVVSLKPADTTPLVSKAPSIGATTTSSSSSTSRSSSASDDGILDLAVKTLSSGLETIGNALLLTTRILAAPLALGMRLLRLK